MSGLGAPRGAAEIAGTQETSQAAALNATLLLIGIYAAAAILLLPFASLPGPQIAGISTFFAAGVFVTESSTGFLLFVRFYEQRSASLLVLACGYVFSALMTIPYVLTFPSAMLVQGPVLGGSQSTAWIFIFWMWGFGLLTLIAVGLEAWRPDLRVALAGVTSPALAIVVAAVAVISMLSIMHPEWLPLLVEPDGRWTALDMVLSYVSLLMLLAGIGTILVVNRGRHELFLWLSLALTAMLFGQLLSAHAGGRFTIGWSAARLSWVFSGCALFLYFMSQFVRQQTLLGRSRAALEGAVATRTSELSEMIGQRDLLLREVHHRVKNNFQVINSLISFQGAQTESDETKRALQNLHGRIYALGLVHQRLMQSDNLATFDVRVFLRDLCNNVAALSSAAERQIAITAAADPLQTDLDFAGPLGLLVTELVSAAFEHFGEDQHGVIHVGLHRRSDARLILDVTDNARRPAGSPDALSTGPRVRIVHALVAQLSGTLERTQAHGTAVRVTMRVAELCKSSGASRATPEISASSGAP